MNDLFLDKKTKREMLLDWIIEYLETHNWLRTSQIIAWGTKNFSNRADRDARQLCSEGRFRRMTEEEKRLIACMQLRTFMYRMIFNRLGSWSLFAILFTAFLVWYVYDSYQYDKDMDNFEKTDRQQVYGRVQA